MSTALPTHHRIVDPVAAAAAVAVVIGGAAVLGVAMSGEPTAPTAPGQTRLDRSPSRIGLGDFTRVQAAGHLAPVKGGHTVIGLP
jgi:hypothetical protein